MHVAQDLQGAASGHLPQHRVFELFGLCITDTTIEQAASWIVQRAQHRLPTQVSFLNADCVNVMHRDQDYQNALVSSDRVFADGIGVKIAARWSGQSLCDNVNGTDLFPILCQQAAEASVGVFLFGAKPGRAEASADRMQAAYPKLNIAGCHHGYLASAADEEALIEQINASGAEIVLVALGAPSQELWIARNRHRLKPAVLIGVGGLFDYYSGAIARAPRAVRQARLEWVWRLAMEPRRLAKRYIIGNVEFLARIAISGTRQMPTRTAA